MCKQQIQYNRTKEEDLECKLVNWSEWSKCRCCCCPLTGDTWTSFLVHEFPLTTNSQFIFFILCKWLHFFCCCIYFCSVYFLLLTPCAPPLSVCSSPSSLHHPSTSMFYNKHMQIFFCYNYNNNNNNKQYAKKIWLWAIFAGCWLSMCWNFNFNFCVFFFLGLFSVVLSVCLDGRIRCF